MASLADLERLAVYDALSALQREIARIDERSNAAPLDAEERAQLAGLTRSLTTIRESIARIPIAEATDASVSRLNLARPASVHLVDPSQGFELPEGLDELGGAPAAGKGAA